MTQVNLKFDHAGAGETAQLVKCLPSKHQNLSPIPSMHIKSRSSSVAFDPSTGEVVMGGRNTGTHCSTRESNQQVPHPSERPHLKKQDGQLLRLTFDHYIYLHT